ncbi:hypothetical protein K503DRAFT_645355, partial [Rhizopogon vinicolor AM-OR11-026]
MPVSIDIVPLSDSLELFGESDLSSAFSLAGHVSVSISSPSSMFQRRQSTTRVLLQSLSITFEGQSEVLTPDIGYAPLRLCSITRELVNSEPVHLSNEGHEDSHKSCSWNVTFDIPVPGWLPTTSTYGDQGAAEAGTRYALYAVATFIYLEDGSSSILSSFCSPFRRRTHNINAPRRPIILTRFAEIPSGLSASSSTSVFPMALFLVDAQPGQDGTETDAKAIPAEVLKNIQVVASIPNAVTMDETSFPFLLRLRGNELDDSQRERLRITDFSIDVEQFETYRSTISRESVARFLVPPTSQQPPSVPLRSAHPVHTLYDIGLLTTQNPSRSSSTRSFSLLDPSNSGKYVISGDGRVFLYAPVGDAARSPSENWYVLEASVPLAREPHELDWAGPRTRHISEDSPLFTVHHMMHIALQCAYEYPDGEVVCERLHFSLPMRHVRVPTPIASSATDFSQTLENAMEHQKSAPYGQSLPAYSQLFHSNGERKIDYSIPLPLYEPS